jgi:hypothetical protein
MDEKEGGGPNRKKRRKDNKTLSKKSEKGQIKRQKALIKRQ